MVRYCNPCSWVVFKYQPFTPHSMCFHTLETNNFACSYSVIVQIRDPCVCFEPKLEIKKLFSFFQEFFTANPAPAAERSIQQAVENVRLNAMWMKNESSKVTKFLLDCPSA